MAYKTAIAAVSVLCLASFSAHAWERGKGVTGSQSSGNAVGVGVNSGPGSEFAGAQSQSRGIALRLPNGTQTSVTSSGSGFSKGIGPKTYGGESFQAGSAAFGADFRR